MSYLAYSCPFCRNESGSEYHPHICKDCCELHFKAVRDAMREIEVKYEVGDYHLPNTLSGKDMNAHEPNPRGPDTPTVTTEKKSEHECKFNHRWDKTIQDDLGRYSYLGVLCDICDKEYSFATFLEETTEQMREAQTHVSNTTKPCNHTMVKEVDPTTNLETGYSYCSRCGYFKDKY